MQRGDKEPRIVVLLSHAFWLLELTSRGFVLRGFLKVALLVPLMPTTDIPEGMAGSLNQ